MSESQVEASQAWQVYMNRLHKMVLPYKRCWHYIPLELATQLPHRSVCPACTVERHIRAARRINSEFADRDGIFQSKAAGRKENEAIGSPNSRGWRKHRQLVERWRRARVSMRRDISRLEELVESASLEDCTECSKMLHGALEMYEKWAMSEHEPPGCSNESEGGDAKSTLDQSLPTLASSPVESSFRSSSSSIDSRKSCLKKGRYSSDDQAAPTSPKTVAIEDHAQVFSTPAQDDADNVPEKAGVEEPCRRPHRECTSREKARPKKTIRRSLSCYQRGFWASPEGYTKQETSFMTFSWDDIETAWADDRPDETADEQTTGMEEVGTESLGGEAGSLATEEDMEKEESQEPEMQQYGSSPLHKGIYKRMWAILKKL